MMNICGCAEMANGRGIFLTIRQMKNLWWSDFFMTDGQIGRCLGGADC